MNVGPLINVAAEDDLFIAAASDGLPTRHASGLSGKGDEHDFVGLEATSIHQREDIVKISKQMEQILELSESPEQKPTKTGKYNLRKSLAWDNAFFTSEGVLNAEELAIVNSTYMKADARTLPRIPEDIRKSTESTSTLDSDSWALETLEVNLFENLRASIQKSLRKCDSKTATKQGELNASHLRASKKVVSSQNEMKLPSALQRHGVIRRRPEDTSREALICMKVDASVSRDSKTSLKPPRIAPRVTALPTAPGKKTSASGRVPTKSNGGKGLSVNAANRDSVVALKRSGESGTVTPRSIPSLKSTSRSHQGNEVSSVGSSLDSSSKSPLENSRKRTARNIDHPTCGSTAKSLMRTSKSKLGSSNSNNTPTSLKSMLKPSSSVSPHSSVDSLVSEASSSKSLSMKSSNSTEDLDAGSSSSPSITVTFDKSVRQSSDFHKFSTDQPCSRTGNSETLLPQGQLSSGNHSKSYVDGGIGVNCFKASGLRMPTPNIGYFDAEKSLVRSSNKYPQSGLQNDASKNTAISNLVGANKLKPSKAPSVKPAAQTATTDPDSPYVQATRLSSIHVSKPVSPSTLRRLSKPAELCGTLSHELSCESIMGSSLMDNKDSLPKIFEVEAEVSDVTEELASKLNFKHMITTPVGNESASSGEGFSNISCKIMQLTQQMGGTETHQQLSCLSHMEEFRMQNDPCSTAQTIQKEHCFHVDNTDGLSTHAD